MTPDEITRRLGQERRRVFYRSSGEDVWDWDIELQFPGEILRFDLDFEDGGVMRTTRSVVMREQRIRGL